ncbi:MAG TPA: TcpQ domain-containing protein [Burkholderiaceae bacterium]
MSGRWPFEPIPSALRRDRPAPLLGRAWLGLLMFPLLALALDERDERVPAIGNSLRPSPQIERAPVPGPVGGAEAGGQAAATSTGDGPGRFAAAAGERLSVALSRFVAGYGWDLEWDAGPDFVIQRAYAIGVEGADLRSAIARVLSPYRLSAVLHNSPPQRVVSIIAGSTAGRDGAAQEARP